MQVRVREYRSRGGRTVDILAALLLLVLLLRLMVPQLVRQLDARDALEDVLLTPLVLQCWLRNVVARRPFLPWLPPQVWVCCATGRPAVRILPRPHQATHPENAPYSSKRRPVITRMLFIVAVGSVRVGARHVSRAQPPGISRMLRRMPHHVTVDQTREPALRLDNSIVVFQRLLHRTPQIPMARIPELQVLPIHNRKRKHERLVHQEKLSRHHVLPCALVFFLEPG
mmetsp:Transcript_28156/g.67260  ORF Transcript_28156/g.67260 Transcript_28156/m.67260 type:complete len:227 (-) Transcript_28156:120-800(-)